MSSKPKQFRKRARDSDDEDDSKTNSKETIITSSIPTSITKTSSSVSTGPSTIVSNNNHNNNNPHPSSTIPPSSSSLSNKDKQGITSFSTVVPKQQSILTNSDAQTFGGTIAYTSTGTGTAYQYGGGVFSYNEINTSENQDARAALEKKINLQEQAITDLEQGKRIYRGLVGYTTFQQQKGTTEEIISQAKISGTIGPVRAPTNVRGICRIDYQPDVCKDYKETGQCPFGDSCKFLHDRSDYKSGWEIEVEWQRKQKRKTEKLAERLAQGKSIENISDSEEEEDKKNNTNITDDGTTGNHQKREWKIGFGSSKYNKYYQNDNGSSSRSTDNNKTNSNDNNTEDLPFACFICRKPFTNPIQTVCNHYFCELCAIQRHHNYPLCAVCGKPTLGIFNAAPKLEARIKELAERENNNHEDDNNDNNYKGYSSKTNKTGGGIVSGWSTVTDDNHANQHDSDATPSSPVGDSDASTDQEITNHHVLHKKSTTTTNNNKTTTTIGNWDTVAE